MTTKKTTKKKAPRTKTPRKKAARAEQQDNGPPPQAIVLQEAPRYDARPVSRIDPLLNDLPSVTLKDETEAFFHFSRIDPRLAEAWKRDVVMHEGPITLRRVMSPTSFGGATHYAYVDRRVLWYLKRDPSDPLGARWDGYLANRSDAPPGTTAVIVGSDIVVRKGLPQLTERTR